MSQTFVARPSPSRRRWTPIGRPSSVVLLVVALLLVLVPHAGSYGATAEPPQIGTFPVSEGSGVVESRQYPGVFWAHRDSGTGTRNVLVAFKVEDGQLVEIVPGKLFRTVHLPDLVNRDWEDISVDEQGHLWLGDIGNNSYNRANLAVHQIDEPDPYTATSADVIATYPFTWPDAACATCSGRDAESLIVRDGVVHLISKAKNPALYRLPTLTPGASVELERLGSLTPPTSGWANLTTAADLSWDGTRLVVAIAGHHALVYETSDTGLSGSDLLLDLISRAPAYVQPYDDGGTWETVEGAAFGPGTHDLVLLSENGPILYASDESYDGVADTPASDEPSTSESTTSESTTITGSGSDTSNSWQVFPVSVPEAGTITATLDWDDPGADLNLWLKDPSGTTVAHANGTSKPEIVAHETTTVGDWSVAVQIKTGAADFVLDLALEPTVVDSTGTSDTSGTSDATQEAGLAPTDGALLGLWSKPPNGDWTKESVIQRFEHLEALSGRTMDIAQSYHKWDGNFPSWREAWAVEGGRTPLISWDGVDTGEIANGLHDEVIRARADAVAAFESPVLLRWMWEMDIKGDRIAAPSEFIDAWRRVHDTFGARGVDNVEWVWCPTSWGFTSGDAQAYYPGDAYVDWTCADGYNWAPGRTGSEWRTMSEIFHDFYAWAEPIGKPIMIGETGVQERHAGEKAEWFRLAIDELQTDMPAVDALVYFDSDTIYPWWIDSTQQAVEAWAELAGHPYFNTRSTGTGGSDDGTSEPAPEESPSEEPSDETPSDTRELQVDPEAEHVFTGTGSDSQDAWQVHDVEVEVTGTLDVLLDWDNPDADLNLFVRDPDGNTVAYASGSELPEVVTHEAARTGTWSVAVDHRIGAAAHALSVNVPNPGTSEDATSEACSDDLLHISGRGAGTHAVQVPTATRLTGILEHDPRAKYDIVVLAPDGSRVVDITSTESRQSYSWDAPASGTWTVQLTHRGPARPYSLAVQCAAS